MRDKELAEMLRHNIGFFHKALNRQNNYWNVFWFVIGLAKGSVHVYIYGRIFFHALCSPVKFHNSHLGFMFEMNTFYHWGTEAMGVFSDFLISQLFWGGSHEG